MVNDLNIYRGDDKSWTLTFKDSSGTAINITGYTVFFTVKKNKSDVEDDALITKDITSHSDAGNGQTTLSITNTESAIAVGEYWYDIQTKDGSGNINTVVVGNFNVLQDVTVRTS